MFFVFDIGGTNMRLAVSRDGVTLGEPTVVPTPQHFDEAMRTLGGLAEKMREGVAITAAAGGIAGPLNRERTHLVASPNLPEWVGRALQEELSETLGVPVSLENDSTLSALGEAREGAGRGFPIVAYVTVGTGVGGARIVEGKIDKNSHGFEPGHQIIDLGGAACPTCNALGKAMGGKGHLEGYVSGASLTLRTGKEPREIIDLAVWEELASFLAVGVANTIVHWSPDVVVLGGSMIIKKPGIQVETVEKHLKKVLTIFPTPVPLKQATLGDFGGLHGALALCGNKK